MKKQVRKIIVMSLGGSLIVPDEINTPLLNKFKQVIKKNLNKYKFVIVCGGGSIARKYIKALREQGKSEYLQSMSGIAVTRMNARFMTYFFGKDANQGIPHDMKHIASLLRRRKIVFCGALRYKPDNTSDGTAASLAGFLNCEFINITDVKGVYTSNPKTHKNAEFLKNVSWKQFNEMASKIKFKAGQHFVLDQNASKIIMKNKVPTYIIGDLGDLDRILSGKSYKGSLIYG